MPARSTRHGGPRSRISLDRRVSRLRASELHSLAGALARLRDWRWRWGAYLAPRSAVERAWSHARSGSDTGRLARAARCLPHGEHGIHGGYTRSRACGFTPAPGCFPLARCHAREVSSHGEAVHPYALPPAPDARSLRCSLIAPWRGVSRRRVSTGLVVWATHPRGHAQLARLRGQCFRRARPWPCRAPAVYPPPRRPRSPCQARWSAVGTFACTARPCTPWKGPGPSRARALAGAGGGRRNLRGHGSGQMAEWRASGPVLRQRAGLERGFGPD